MRLTTSSAGSGSTAPPFARHSSSTTRGACAPHISSARRYQPTTVRQSGALKVSASRVVSTASLSPAFS